MRKLMLAILMMSASWGALGEPAGSAREVVETLDAALVEVMKNAKALGYEGRYTKLEDVVAATHDFEAIAKVAVGKYWKDLTEDNRAALVARLRDFSIATYAAQFDAYNGEEFKFEAEDPAKGTRQVLHYALKVPGEPDHKFDYMLNQTDGRWRIVNIVVDGISDLALKRAQYESIIEKEGFARLLDKLAEKIADYARTRAERQDS